MCGLKEQDKQSYKRVNVDECARRLLTINNMLAMLEQRRYRIIQPAGRELILTDTILPQSLRSFISHVWRGVSIQLPFAYELRAYLTLDG